MVMPFNWITTIEPTQRINQLINLKPNWDGYGGICFSQEQVDRALNVYSLVQDYCSNNKLDLLYVQPFIAPCSNGEILFDWSGVQFKYKQLELYVHNRLDEPLTYLKTEGESDYEGECDLSNINELLDWLIND